KAGGAGWTISAGLAESPFGNCVIAEGPRGISHLAFVESDDADAELAKVRERWPKAQLRRDDANAERLASQIFQRPDRSDRGQALRAFVRGTEFQVRVWRALLHVQPGALVSYGRLAAAIGQPTAARAVGAAVGRNPLAFLIPCHRVIRETGVIGNYRWGTTRKRAILAWEGAAHLPAAEDYVGASTPRDTSHTPPPSMRVSGR
ncbi:MAG: methylated-DNA--[protein]-cysteine S-methyltransferase, partial [Nitrospirota bacterium]